MPRPHSTGERFPSGHPTSDNLQELIESTARDQSECELCESTAVTSVEYGMRVCSTCERELLP